MRPGIDVIWANLIKFDLALRQALNKVFLQVHSIRFWALAETKKFAYEWT